MRLERGLDGVAVADSQKVITNFKRKQARTQQEHEEYNFTGSVPAVNPRVAKAYLQMRVATLKKQTDPYEHES